MPNITRRFIGHLQTNKVNKCLELFDTIDSVDSFKLAEKINNRSSFLNKKTSILLEINTSGDKSKKGFHPNLDDDFYSVFELDSLKVDGLMTMGPLSQKEDETRNAFALLRKIKTKINDQLPAEPIKELSMGMSGDFQIGIEEGSSMVRLGTAIFGKRNY